MLKRKYYKVTKFAFEVILIECFDASILSVFT